MKSAWSHPPELQQREPGLWRLQCPAIFWSETLQTAIMVPVSFETDLKVGPQKFYELLGRSWAGQQALVLIDWLYSAQPTSRELCDKVAYEVMRASGVGFFVARAAAQLLRDEGETSWKAANLPQFDRVKQMMELAAIEPRS